MAQITNADTFTVIIPTESITSLADETDIDVVDIDTIEDVVKSFGLSNYIIGISKQTWGTEADTYPSILQDLETVTKKKVVDRHICVGSISLAQSVEIIQTLITSEYFAGIASMEIKTATTSGRRFIIAKLRAF